MNAPQEFDGRMAKVRQAMRDKGLQALLVFDAGRHNFLRTNYVAYLTDFISVGPETILVLPLEEEPALYLTPVWDIPRAKHESAVSDVRPFKEFWHRLPNLGSKIGLIGREFMHVSLHDKIAQALKQPPVNTKEIIDSMARRKSAFELERLKKAAAIADAGVQALHEDARVGLKEFELAAIVEYRMRFLGAEDNFGMVSATVTIRRFTRRRIEPFKPAMSSSEKSPRASADCSCKSAGPWLWESRRPWWRRNTIFSKRRWA